MTKGSSFTEGKILAPLVRFTFPILFALILQALYGAVDVAVVSWYADAAEIAAVSVGTQLMRTITSIIVGLSMGTTVLIGQRLGAGNGEGAGRALGAAICLFGVMGAALSVILPFLSEPLAHLMNTAEEALDATVDYLRICSIGTVFIVAYNVLGGMFRGMGDSKTPLITVLVAAVVNMGLDVLLVAEFHMAAKGAALATVISQALSVLFCLVIAKKRGFPFPFAKRMIRFDGGIVGQTLKIGTPVALQDFLVSISFLVITACVNRLGAVAAAGMGVAEKLCAFIMMIPSAFSQALTAFVAQNIGAGKKDRARNSLMYGIVVSLACGALMSYVSFFHGDLLARIFADGKTEVIQAAWDYLKAYAVDTMLVAFLFCFIGYFNGCGQTRFVMMQGLIGALGIRAPLSWLISRNAEATLFHIGLATPASTMVQILLCGGYMWWMQKKRGTEERILHTGKAV